MVPNPICDGPVYESVHAQLESLTSTTLQVAGISSLACNNTQPLVPQPPHLMIHFATLIILSRYPKLEVTHLPPTPMPIPQLLTLMPIMLQGLLVSPNHP